MTHSFTSYDGTRLAYRRTGEGRPLVCLPGGPGRDADYLGDLGGLGPRAGRELVILEPRGTGASAVPGDPATCRCVAAQAAALFPSGQFTVQPAAAHFPWVNDPAWFAATLAAFLVSR